MNHTYRPSLRLCVTLLCVVALSAGCPLVLGNAIVWAKRGGGEGSDRAYGLTALSDGTSLVTGYFTGDAALCGCPDQHGDISSSGGRDMFVSLYGTSGIPVWVRTSSGEGDNQGRAVDGLDDGTSVVTGFFTDDATFGGSKDGGTVLSSAGDMDVFTVGYDGDGVMQWVAGGGSTGTDAGMGVSICSDGSCVATGYFSGSATFSDASKAQVVVNSAGDLDFFLARYSSAGLLQWVATAGGTTADAGYAVSAFDDGSCIVTGTFSGTATFGTGAAETTLTAAGALDAFVAKYNSDGALAWVARIGGTTGDDEGNGVAVLDGGSCVVAGCFSGTATFEDAAKASGTDVIGQGGQDVFVAKYDSSGSLLWVAVAGGVDNDAGYDVRPVADGTFVVTGSFQSTAVFGAGEANESTQCSEGEDDVFVAKLDADGALLWAKRAGGSLSDIGFGIGALPDGKSLVAGRFRGNAGFGAGLGNYTVLRSEGYCDIFVAKYPD
ncbi:MAG: hypothetical protein JXR94_09095 [Candidatus Hydrogenedentes bacterium]|nr:hypothetical protein [Candidatus Hydrogenedentota bacterium]